MAKVRLDQLLTLRGLAPSREQARALIMAGLVRVSGQPAGKPGHGYPDDAPVEVAARQAYVSRGGYKLAGALDAFSIDPADRVCADIGSSTGGFTDCLLQRGAKRVYAFDVGTGQLDWRLRNDPRVVARENFNARHLAASDVAEPVSLLVCDVSFISVTKLLPGFPAILSPGGEMVILVKPQFEAGPGMVGRGGIVRDPEVHSAVCAAVEEVVRRMGFAVGIIESPITGAEGNREFLLHAKP